MAIAQIDGIQVLRGVAASLVAAFHLYAAAVHEGLDPGVFSHFRNGEAGVDIFFVLSGFIIFYVASQTKERGAKDFILARFWRILPPYWAVLACYIAAFAAMAVLFGDASRLPDAWSAVVSVLLLPAPDHVIVIAWTLAMELMFYLVFTLTFYSGGPRLFFIAMLVWAAAGQVVKVIYLPDVPYWMQMPLNSIVVEFLFGSLIAYAYLNHRPGFQILALAIGIIGLVLTMLFEIHEGIVGREFAFGIPSAFIVYGLAGMAQKMPRILTVWGDASYLLYLMHPLVYLTIGKMIEVVTGFNVYGSTAAMVGLLIVATLVTMAAHVLFEKPYQRWYKARMLPSRSRPERA